MKLKSKVLLALVLGLSVCGTLGVSAFWGDDDSSSSSSSSESGSSSYCSPAGSDSGSDSFPSSPVVTHPTVKAPGERGILGAPLYDKTRPATGAAAHCASFEELAGRLRARQEINGWRSVVRVYGDESHAEDTSEHVYWINTALPSANINLYNKWFGNNVQDYGGDLVNPVAALLPTARALSGCSYTRAELENIILDESNWVALRGGMQSTTGGVATWREAESPNFDHYAAEITKKGFKFRS